MIHKSVRKGIFFSAGCRRRELKSLDILTKLNRTEEASQARAESEVLLAFQRLSTASPRWHKETAIRFAEANARVGSNFREHGSKNVRSLDSPAATLSSRIRVNQYHDKKSRNHRHKARSNQNRPEGIAICHEADQESGKNSPRTRCCAAHAAD